MVAAAGVALAYLTGEPERSAPVARFGVAGLEPGEVRAIDWHGGPVIVLHRRAATVEALDDVVADDNSPRWFVARASGPARGCPLRWRRGPARFVETCIGARYDAAGRPVDGNHGPALKVPPHHFTADRQLVLGAD